MLLDENFEGPFKKRLQQPHHKKDSDSFLSNWDSGGGAMPSHKK